MFNWIDVALTCIVVVGYLFAILVAGPLIFIFGYFLYSLATS